MGQIITVASGKGGAGKSTVATGIACCLQKAGHRVLLVDTDFGLCSAELLLSCASNVVYHMGDVISRAVTLERAVITSKKSPDFLAAGSSVQDAEQVAKVLTECATAYDYVIVDRPAGLAFELESFLPSFCSLVVAQIDGMGIRGAATACSLLKQVGSVKCFVIINRFQPALVKGRAAPDIDTVCDTVGAQLLGIVPEDEALFTYQTKGSFSSKTLSGRALTRIAARLTGQTVPLPKLKKLMK